MSNFEAAVEMSLNNWVASFPTEFDLPEPTEEYKKVIAKLMDKMRGDRYHKLTRSAARAILIAAIILAIATATIAATFGREFIVQKYKEYSTYSVVDTSNIKDVDDIEVGYIPKGFSLSKKEIIDSSLVYSYKNDDKWINIYKTQIYHEMSFDTEYKNSEKLETASFSGIYYTDDNLNYSGIIWNNGFYMYNIEGTISKEELTKIAENIT